MNYILKSAALTLAALTLLSSSVFAADSLIPLRSTFEEYGFTVTWDQEALSVTVEKDGFTFTEKVGERIKLDYDKTYISDSFLSEIMTSYQKEMLSSVATVIEVGEGYILADSEKLGEAIFKIDANTHIHHEMNRMLYTIKDIAAGDSIKVYYSEAMTASIPPQLYAAEIVVLVTPQVEEAVSLTKSGKVIETGDDFFVIETENGRYHFNCDESTNIHHIMNRRFYTIKDITTDMELEVTHSDAMTMSLPPQSYAIEVVIK